MFARFAIIIFASTFFSHQLFSQGCCSGGSGSPIAGGASQGVLQKGQMEIGSNYQYALSSKVYTGSQADTASQNQINKLYSNYLYARVAYGITSKLTVSVEGGYFFNKEIILNHPENIDNERKASGFSDLIIFPKYDIYDHTTENAHTEITVGAGIKIPLGKYNDSTYAGTTPALPGFPARNIYYTLPPLVQPTTGSVDYIFYTFAFHEFKRIKFRVFANAMYMYKGYNPLGEKFGDYASVGLFAGKTFFKKFGVTLQAKYEWVDKLVASDIVQGKYSVTPDNTGMRKISLVPQISYNYKQFTVFALTDMPLYQFVNGTQIASQYLNTIGITYRFLPKKYLWKKTKNENL
jgi:hypothetical protein